MVATDSQKSTTKKPGRMGRRKVTPDLKTFSGRTAARLRELREARGKTVDEMCDALAAVGYPVPVSTYYEYENGRTKVNLDALPYLAEVLGRSPRTVLPEE